MHEHKTWGCSLDKHDHREGLFKHVRLPDQTREMAKSDRNRRQSTSPYPRTCFPPQFWSAVYISDVNISPLGQVLAKNGDNVKAKFRKGKALGELGFFEKSTAILEDLLKTNEEGPGRAATSFAMM